MNPVRILAAGPPETKGTVGEQTRAAMMDLGIAVAQALRWGLLGRIETRLRERAADGSLSEAERTTAAALLVQLETSAIWAVLNGFLREHVLVRDEEEARLAEAAGGEDASEGDLDAYAAYLAGRGEDTGRLDRAREALRSS